MPRWMAAVYDGMLAKTEEACLRAWRRELLEGLSGSVLDVGAGTGLNLEHYPAAVTRLVLSEPDPFMRRKLDARIARFGRTDVETSDAALERLPFADASFDYVVSTLVLCSVNDPSASVAEVRRVLKPGGAFVFLEHVAAEERPGRLKWQRRIEPVWKRLMGNCHLTRTSAATIAASGLQLQQPVRESMRKSLPWVRATVRGRALKPA